MCSVCDFWIHPDCAVLPSAIIVDKVIHEHPLLLSYEEASPTCWSIYYGANVCAICEGQSEGFGRYTCFHCRYSAHIKCLVYANPPHNYQQVLIRDAQVPGLIHLPMADEHQSVMQRIMKTTSSSNNDGDHGSKYFKVHKHPLIFHDGDGIARVCNACVKLISPSDPFYSCSSREYEEVSCRDFFLHSSCVHLPSTIKDQQRELSLLLNVDKYPFNLFWQYNGIMHRRCNGFSYFWEECRVNINVVSILMPASITHDAHAKSHILHKTTNVGGTCSCCNIEVVGFPEDRYVCNNCYNFSIHAECALLPDTVSHEFDRHPLKLITNTPTSLDRQEEEEDIPFCEICEENMESGPWFYGCKKCDQSFHIACIPYFDDLSGIKFGFTVGVTCHDCPLACVRALSVDGYRCGHCDDVIRKSHEIAFECAKCDYRIHEMCAQQFELKG